MRATSSASLGCGAHRRSCTGSRHRRARPRPLGRAVNHAVRAGDEQGRADAMTWLASAAREGPTPVMEAIPRCEAILEQLQANRRSQADTMRPLASMHAMAGRLDRARELFDRANAI